MRGKALAFLLLLFLYSGAAQAQQQADSLLPEAVITAYGVERLQPLVPAAVSILSTEDFYRIGEATPVLAFQQLPGVRLEERAPGSYRVSIRGSALRSPFGVRNVKVYWNNIPVTEANGSTPLNLLDVALYKQVEVIRGPAASYYGAGTGGVISIGSIPSYYVPKGQPEAELSAGQFGYRRAMAAYTKADSAHRFITGITHVETEGYRQHSELERQNIFWSSRARVSTNRELLTNVLLARIRYEIPGGLTLEQFNEDPQQPRPNSISRDASINQKYALLSVGQRYQFSENFENSTLLFGNASFLDHPFITDYKRDLATGIGYRSIWSWVRDWNNATLTLQAGSEAQLGFEVARNYGNRAGQPDTLNFEDEITSRTALFFLQSDIAVGQKWTITTGLSFNNYSYTINRLFDASPAPAYQLDKQLDPVWAPRLALAYQLLERTFVWGQISKGFSPPSLEEVRTNEGSLNEDLEAERGTNYEIGVKGSTAGTTFRWSTAIYYFSLQQTITSYIGEESPVTRFRNAGSARQFGAEAALEARWVQQKNWLVSSQLSGAWQHYRFEDYQQQENDYSGNAQPGIAPLTTAVAANVLYRQRLGLSLTHTFTDRIPLNDANDVYVEGYHLVHARLDYKPHWWEQLEVAFFLSGQNLLNERYSLGYDLNAYGGRYYQPAAERSFFIGVQLRP